MEEHCNALDHACCIDPAMTVNARATTLNVEDHKPVVLEILHNVQEFIVDLGFRAIFVLHHVQVVQCVFDVREFAILNFDLSHWI